MPRSTRTSTRISNVNTSMDDGDSTHEDEQDCEAAESPSLSRSINPAKRRSTQNEIPSDIPMHDLKDRKTKVVNSIQGFIDAPPWIWLGDMAPSTWAISFLEKLCQLLRRVTTNAKTKQARKLRTDEVRTWLKEAAAKKNRIQVQHDDVKRGLEHFKADNVQSADSEAGNEVDAAPDLTQSQDVEEVSEGPEAVMIDPALCEQDTMPNSDTIEIPAQTSISPPPSPTDRGSPSLSHANDELGRKQIHTPRKTSTLASKALSLGRFPAAYRPRSRADIQKKIHSLRQERRRLSLPPSAGTKSLGHIGESLPKRARSSSPLASHSAKRPRVANDGDVIEPFNEGPERSKPLSSPSHDEIDTMSAEWSQAVRNATEVLLRQFATRCSSLADELAAIQTTIGQLNSQLQALVDPIDQVETAKKSFEDAKTAHADHLALEQNFETNSAPSLELISPDALQLARTAAKTKRVGLEARLNSSKEAVDIANQNFEDYLKKTRALETSMAAERDKLTVRNALVDKCSKSASFAKAMAGMSATGPSVLTPGTIMQLEQYINYYDKRSGKPAAPETHGGTGSAGTE